MIHRPAAELPKPPRHSTLGPPACRPRATWIRVPARFSALNRWETRPLSVALIFDVTALLAEISAGLLTGVRAGRCEIAAILAIDVIEVASSRARLDLPGAIPVAPGIRLLADQDHQVGG